MTAVLPPVRSASSGRHRAPDGATTGSLGPIPQEWLGRAAHGAPAGLAGTGQLPIQRTRPASPYGDPAPETPAYRPTTAYPASSYRSYPATPHTGAQPAAAPRAHSAHRAPAPLHRAARTAGLSLAALGALAGAGGVAAHGLLPADEPASTGSVALPANLAASNMTLQPHTASPITSVMPVTAAPATAAAPQVKTVSASATKAAAAPATQAKAAPAPAAKDDADPASSKGSSMASEAIAAAESRLGKPYVWGATGPNSFDCSGLMQYAYDKAGKDLPRTSRAQSQVGEKVSMDDLQPGDLIFFYSPVSHVAMYVGDGKVIEAPNSGEDVKYTSLSKIEKNAVSARRMA